PAVAPRGGDVEIARRRSRRGATRRRDAEATWRSARDRVRVSPGWPRGERLFGAHGHWQDRQVRRRHWGSRLGHDRTDEACAIFEDAARLVARVWRRGFREEPARYRDRAR